MKFIVVTKTVCAILIGLFFLPLFLNAQQFPSYNELTLWSQSLTAAHPLRCQMNSIGQSLAGREIWELVLTLNPNAERHTDVIFSGGMHGDEPLPPYMLLRFAEDFLTENFAGATADSFFNNLAETRIHILPLTNPDGYEAGIRHNGAGVDINRDFPALQQDPVNTVINRQPETAALMSYFSQYSGKLCADLHSGHLGICYPLDATTEFVPNEQEFMDFGAAYLERHPSMANDSPFTGGIIQGGNWYISHGSLGDWNYWYSRNIPLTIEVWMDEHPDFAVADSVYILNKLSLLSLAAAGSRTVWLSCSISGNINPPMLMRFGQLESTTLTDGNQWHGRAWGRSEYLQLVAAYPPGFQVAENSNINFPVHLTAIEVDLGVSSPVLALFEDDFSEADNNWTLEGDWEISQTLHGTFLMDSPAGLYQAGVNNSAVLPLLTITDEAYTLSFDYCARLEPLYDKVFIEYSRDALVWIEIDRITGNFVWTHFRVEMPQLIAGQLYLRFRLQTDNAGQRDGIAINNLSLRTSDTSIDSPASETFIGYVVPNPYRVGEGNVKFCLPQSKGRTYLNIYNIQGRFVQRLSMRHGISFWNGNNFSGQKCGTGIYLYRISKQNKNSVCGKFLIIK
ncbi:MAG: T9SS type A sorting domain-containing protein [Candidatus Cloacimonetes bacterium]|nr:T9SS type A sorting domain-containing protein [Candidatus Cloacimonadota bacterium]